AAAMAAFLELRLDLRSRAVHEDKPHAERRQKIQVVRKVKKPSVRDHFAAERDDEGLAAKLVDIGRNRLEPVDEPVLRGQPLARCRASRGLSTWSRFRGFVSRLASNVRLPSRRGCVVSAGGSRCISSGFQHIMREIRRWK